MPLESIDRTAWVRRGQRLEYFTVAYNSLEAAVALLAAWMAGSKALLGFGLDSVIEVASGGVLLWRLRADVDEARREELERTALRMVGLCFLGLALYVSYDSLAALVRRRAPDHSLPGIALAVVSLAVMPLLARAKEKVARSIGSAALDADATQTWFCTYLSAILLAGLALNALWGWWWADPAAALGMTPLIAREGIETLRGRSCCATKLVTPPAGDSTM